MVHLHHFSKIKSHKVATKQEESLFTVSHYFCLTIEGSGSISLDADPGGPKHLDPTDPDPDPQHC
jgi:hypothetical protein